MRPGQEGERMTDRGRLVLLSHAELLLFRFNQSLLICRALTFVHFAPHLLSVMLLGVKEAPV